MKNKRTLSILSIKEAAMKKKRILNVFAIVMTALLGFSGVGWAAPAQDDNPAARGPTPEEYGIITGTVTDVHGVGVADARIEIWDEATMARGWAWSAANGSFVSTGLVAGTYQMWVFPPEGLRLAPAFIPDIVVTIGVTTTVDVMLEKIPTLVFDVLPRFLHYRDEDIMAPQVRDMRYRVKTLVEGGGIISGRVTCYAGDPVAGARITVWDPEIWADGWAETDQDGYYTTTGLPAGTYEMWVRPPEEVYLAPARISDIVVVAGETTTVDVTLEKGGLISGRVTDQAGAGVANASISVWDPATGAHGWARTDADGNYTTTGLAAGTYEMWVRPPTRVYLAPAFLSGIVVTAGETTTVDVTLEKGGLISGRVTCHEGHPVRHAWVSVWDRATGAHGWAETDGDGHYTTTGLAAGTYAMEVRPPEGVYLAPAFLSGIVVTAGQTTPVNVTLEKGGLISGTVICYDGDPVPNASISVWDRATGARGWARTDADGKYTTTGLAAGTYEMEVRPPEGVYLAPAFISDIVVVAGQTTPVHVTLGKGGLISGRVTDQAGAGVANASISVWDPATGTHGWARTAADGKYTTTGLLPGTYEMRVDPPEGVYLPGHISDIVVVAGQTTTVNVTLEKGGLISGRVTDTDVNPAGRISIHVWDEDTGQWVGHMWTAGDGTYTITVPAGIFGIYLQSPPGGPYLAPAWVRSIEVAAGAITTVDVTLAAGGRVSGKVTDPRGVAVAGAGVRVGVVGVSWWGTMTDEDGSFTTIGLLPGVYEMWVYPPEGVDLTPARIPGIVVTAGQTTTVNVTLKLPGDATGDGKVDPSDLTMIAGAFNTQDTAADINADGIVDIFDLVKVGRNFGKGGN